VKFALRTMARGDGRRFKRRPDEGTRAGRIVFGKFGDGNAAPFNMKSQIVLANN
jgi:hypothetical protein